MTYESIVCALSAQNQSSRKTLGRTSSDTYTSNPIDMTATSPVQPQPERSQSLEPRASSMNSGRSSSSLEIEGILTVHQRPKIVRQRRKPSCPAHGHEPLLKSRLLATSKMLSTPFCGRTKSARERSGLPLRLSKGPEAAVEVDL